MLNVTGYIDASSGSYMLAAIASGAAGSWFFIRSKFAKLRGRGNDPVVETGVVETGVVETGADAEAEAASTDA